MNDRTIDEIVAEMHKEAESKDLFNGEEVGEPLIRGTKVENWADRIEAAAERERNRQYEPKCDWSITDALALANTLANHGLRDGNADAASSCIYSLCRILSSHGNAAAMREALVAIRKALLLDSGMGPHTAFHAEVDMLIAAALSAPPRNCDRCEFWEELWHEFGSEICPDVTDDHQRAWLFIRWLFAKEGGAE